MQLRATFKALYTIIFYDHRENVEQLLREYDSVMPPLDTFGTRLIDSKGVGKLLWHQSVAMSFCCLTSYRFQIVPVSYER